MILGRLDDDDRIEIPFNYYNLVDPSTVEKRGSFERVKKVAEMRNEAMRKALEQFPETTDALMIDSYYTPQLNALQRLIDNYIRHEPQHVRGGAIWCWQKIGIIRKARFYDSWAVPDEPGGLFTPKAEGNRIVDCVGGVYLFPISVWEAHKYGVPNPLRTEHYAMLKDCEIPIILDYESQFWRTPKDSEVIWNSWPKRIRITQGLMRRKIFHV